VSSRRAERGREIAFLGILDACIVPVPPSARRSLAQKVRRYADGLDSPIRMLARPWLRRLANRIGFEGMGGIPGRLPGRLRFEVDTEIADLVRSRAYTAWVAAPAKPRLDCRVTVFRSEEARPGVPRDLGWSAVSDRIDVIDVGGSHLAMLQEPFRQTTARLFTTKIEQSLAV